MIVIKHKNPILENYRDLEATKPEEYQGFIYMWKCIPENMFYIGSHKGIVNDTYRGSGRRFKQVFECYGITKFDRIVLEYVDDATKLKEREQFWMDKFGAATSPMFLNEKNAKRN